MTEQSKLVFPPFSQDTTMNRQLLLLLRIMSSFAKATLNLLAKGAFAIIVLMSLG